MKNFFKRFFQVPEFINARHFANDSILPTRSYPRDGGLDLYANEEILMEPRGAYSVATGVGIEIPHEFVGLICPRSSMSSKGVISALGVVDSGYTGEIQVLLMNHTGRMQVVVKNERIAQIVIVPCFIGKLVEVQEFETSVRGPNGFGSTGL